MLRIVILCANLVAIFALLWLVRDEWDNLRRADYYPLLLIVPVFVMLCLNFGYVAGTESRFSPMRWFGRFSSAWREAGRAADD